MKEKAFTLIELLVVIAIIGVIALIVLVNLSDTREKAKIGRMLFDLKQITTAIHIYYQDTEVMPCHLHGYYAIDDDYCDQAMFITGNFDPKPNSWDGPYLSYWPRNPWESYYKFVEDKPSGSAPGDWVYGIAIMGISEETAQMIDSQIDDGDLNAGDVFLSETGEGDLIYAKSLKNIPSDLSDHIFDPCTP